ncbi:MAG: hypothetical protein JJT75_09635, partial [Opitutales bacterium]|nr:hypothetical protein [Opitutales bacterium]
MTKIRPLFLPLALSGIFLLCAKACTTAASPEKEAILLEADFRNPDLMTEAERSWKFLPDPLPGTGIRQTPHRAAQGVPQALVRSLNEEPLWPDGSLQITRNEVEQGLHRIFPEAISFDPKEEILLMRTTTFADATTGGTNSIAVRLWIQSGLGANEHRERMALSTQFNHHQRGSRQVYPNAYMVRDGWEAWAMPEGTNSRRAGIYYRLGTEPRNEEIRGAEAVAKGYYWTWEGLDWPIGWQPPLGGALYAPPANDEAPFRGDGLYTTTALFRQSDQALSTDPHRFATEVDIQAPRHEGRISLKAPLPRKIEEVRLILRSQTPAEGRDWVHPNPENPLEDPLLGVADVTAQILSRADVNLDGTVDLEDWHTMVANHEQRPALHYHGDVTGNGEVGLSDAFFLAARLPRQTDKAPAVLEDWQALLGEEGEIFLQVPVGGKVYGWKIVAPSGTLPPLHEGTLLGEDSLRQTNEQQIGEANLAKPFQGDGDSPGKRKLGRLSSSSETSDLQIKVQPGLGVPALTLPLHPIPA